MKTKLFLATLVVAASPTLALAAGCNYGHAKTEDVVMSCAPGSVFDADTQKCVPTTG